MTRSLLFISLLFLVNPSAISQQSNQVYVCPPCDNHCDALKFDNAGVCSHCNMVFSTRNTKKL